MKKFFDKCDEFELMYITNDSHMAKTLERVDVDTVFIDLETLGKEERQKNLNTVKSQHSIDDIVRIKQAINSINLLVRVNPLNIGTKNELEEVLAAGADTVMLPMFRDAQTAGRFIKMVDGRAKVNLLIEHIDAINDLDNILELEGIDSIHIGLNDLSISLNQKFLFAPLLNNIVEQAATKIYKKGIRFGIGGIAALGKGTIPAEIVLAEFFYLGARAAILSRSFFSKEDKSFSDDDEKYFYAEVKKIREYILSLKNKTEDFFLENRKILLHKIRSVV